ncbi:amidohydrolase family protein [Stenotrophomonas sp.]|uniref:Xaa-Pro dipeptidase n=1 Tax=Stenotrophomonas sp. TaxID=69392 RepID=UPI0028AA6715|nr:amidohydrolase family protein [Stenotrophomonas sp.]
MRITVRVPALALVVVGVCVSMVAHAGTSVVSAARLLDVRSGRYVQQPQIEIVDGRISRIGRAGDPLPAGAEHIDLGARTLLPGLIDMHVHLTIDPTLGGYQGLEYTDNFWTVVGVVNARRTLRAGFTTVRNLGSAGFDDVALKQAIEAGYIDGPRIVPATFAIGATGGHCHGGGLPPSVTVPNPGAADGPDAIRATVRKLRKFGAEVIKFCGTGGVMSKGTTLGEQQYSQEEMQALVEEAHRLGMKVAVHAHGSSGINAAIRAGTDTIEHASLADAESFKLARAQGTWFSMDIYGSDYILAEGENNGLFAESLQKERQVGRKQRETFRDAHAAGVRMVFGSDAGVYPHGDNARQFDKMVEWGMTPLQAIRAATLDAAEALGRQADVGAVEVGRFGDMVAVDGDPLQDVAVLTRPAAVVKGGRLLQP